MHGLRSKILFMLIIYFAGFATAIYVLAPAEGREQTSSLSERIRSIDWQGMFNRSDETSEAEAGCDAAASVSKSDKLASIASAGFSKFISFAEIRAAEAGGLIKAKLAEQRRYNEERQ